MNIKLPPRQPWSGFSPRDERIRAAAYNEALDDVERLNTCPTCSNAGTLRDPLRTCPLCEGKSAPHRCGVSS